MLILNSYLFNAKKSLKQQEHDSTSRNIHIVMGNEAADCDSVVSAISYAYFMADAAGDSSDIYIPLINICRADMRLHREIIFILKQAEIEIENLIFLDDIDLKEKTASGKIKIILVDHNKLSWKQEYLCGFIEEIIDHHFDEAAYNVKKIIKPVGSCITLISKIIIENNPALIGKKFAAMLLAPILLDTSNLSDKNLKTTDEDKEIAQYLVKKAGLAPDNLFYALHNEKRNIAGFSSLDLLRRDYKEWRIGSVIAGFSSASVPIRQWLAQDKNLTNVIEKFYADNFLEIFILMISYTKNEFVRELVVFSKNSDIAKELCDYLQKNGSLFEEIDVRMCIEVCLPKFLFYTQKKTEWSRKKLQPVVNNFFENKRSNQI